MKPHPDTASWPEQPAESLVWPAARPAPGGHDTESAIEPAAAPRVGSPRRSSSGRLSLHWPRLTWYQELLAVIAGDLVYEVIRASAPQKAAEAFHNAAMLTALEPAWMRDGEAWLRDLTSGSPLLAHVFAGYYALLHLSVTVGVLAWLWWRRPQGYASARTVLFALTFGGLLIFWLFPVAPPRLVTPEAINALGTPAISALDGAGGLDSAVGSLVNPYAAFPSLHVGWAAWCAWAVWAHLRGRRRWLAWLYPLATIVVVIGTANHYVIDVVGGLLVVLLAVVA
ncbi:MAG TPA: phosphatase PAP2 family protein [Kineosporiaceae bacterium]